MYEIYLFFFFSRKVFHAILEMHSDPSIPKLESAQNATNVNQLLTSRSFDVFACILRVKINRPARKIG